MIKNRILNKLTWQEPSYVKDPNRKALFSLMYYEDDNLIDNSSKLTFAPEYGMVI